MDIPTRIFMAYARKDEPLRDKLEGHMALLALRGIVAIWYDRRIEPGQDWDKEIRAELEDADIFLILVSSDLFASKYATGVEVRRAMERHEAGDCIVVPVFLRPCDSEGAPFDHLQALPKDRKPVILWNSEDEAFVSVIDGLKAVLKAPGGHHA